MRILLLPNSCEKNNPIQEKKEKKKKEHLSLYTEYKINHVRKKKGWLSAGKQLIMSAKKQKNKSETTD